MSGSIFGKNFKVATWGESHGKALGAVVDGCPAGISLDEEMIQKYLDRRKPGQNEFSTMRDEADCVSILSGVFEGKTTGTPISMIIYNKDQHSKDYSNIKDIYRPGHADYGFDKKYGFRDYRGGGRSSGRETAGRVMAGAVALSALKELGINVTAFTSSLGGVKCDRAAISKENIFKSPIYMPDLKASGEAEELIKNAKGDLESLGGSIDCVVTGLPAGLGEPVFDKLDALLARACMSVGAVKGVEIGAGFNVANMKGSENNDNFVASNEAGIKLLEEGRLFDDKGNFISIKKETNNSGGILGGISDGDPIYISCAVKPTPSIASEQKTINRDGEETDIVIKGRHDPVIAPRAVVVVESMVGITLMDLLMTSATSKFSTLRDVFGN
ncbi:MAG: chorismate synthase [Lachnospiraceae bacterium]|nr:chorismate synthase [Lachnospiraceae bacterium]